MILLLLLITSNASLFLRFGKVIPIVLLILVLVFKFVLVLLGVSFEYVMKCELTVGLKLLRLLLLGVFGDYLYSGASSNPDKYPLKSFN